MHPSLKTELCPFLSGVIAINTYQCLNAFWTQLDASLFNFIGNWLSSLVSFHHLFTENQVVTFAYLRVNQRNNNRAVSSPGKYQACNFEKELFLVGGSINILSQTGLGFNQRLSFISARSFILQPC
jgi:hypothetical protein